jgi:hypothetical protein
MLAGNLSVLVEHTATLFLVLLAVVYATCLVSGVWTYLSEAAGVALVECGPTDVEASTYTRARSSHGYRQTMKPSFMRTAGHSILTAFARHAIEAPRAAVDVDVQYSRPSGATAALYNQCRQVTVVK